MQFFSYPNENIWAIKLRPVHNKTRYIDNIFNIRYGPIRMNYDESLVSLFMTPRP